MMRNPIAGLRRTTIHIGLSVMIALSVCSVHAQRQPTGSWQMIGADYYDVAVSGTTVLIVGQYGAVLRSTDGGEQWELPYAGTYVDLLAVGFFDDDVAMAIGDDGVMLRSVDAGETWNRVDVVDSGYQAMSLLSWGVGYIVTAQGNILRSTDRGTTWERVTTVATGVGLGHTIAFVDDATGLVVAGSGSLYRTSDSGTTWETVVRDTNRLAGVIAFSDARHGIVCRRDRTVLRTSDSGKTWQQGNGPDHGVTPLSVAMPDTSTIIVGGEIDPGAFDSAYTVARSLDGGTTWTKGWPSGLYTMRDVKFPSVAVVTGRTYMVGLLGVALRSGNFGESWDIVSNAQLDLPLYGHAFLAGIAFADDSVGVIPNDFLGNGGMLRTTNGGVTWTLAPTYIRGLIDPHFFSSTEGIAVGDQQGTYALTADGGRKWVWTFSKSDTPSYFSTQAARWLDRDMGFKTGDSLVYRTTDGGDTWRGSIVRSSSIVRKLSVLNPATLFCLTGFDNQTTKIYRSDDSGGTWKVLLQRSATGSVLTAVTFIDDTTGFVTAREYARKDLGSAKFFRTTDGGKTWDSLFVRDGVPLDVRFFSRENGIAVGEYGSVFVTNDGGRTWEYDGMDRSIPGIDTRVWLGCTLLPDRRTVIAYGWGGIARKVFPRFLSGVDVDGSDAIPRSPITVFPNPLDAGELTIRLDPMVIGYGSRLSLFDMLGREVADLTAAMRFDGSTGVARVARAGLSSGTYLIVLRHDGHLWCRSLVVR